MFRCKKNLFLCTFFGACEKVGEKEGERRGQTGPFFIPGFM